MECDAPKEKRINSGMQDGHYYEELKNWLSKNEIAKLPESDEILRYSDKEHREVLGASPWTKDPHYFNLVKVSAVALLKMLIHAHSGGNIEVRLLVNHSRNFVQDLSKTLDNWLAGTFFREAAVYK